jgi:hypothetical protein
LLKSGTEIDPLKDFSEAASEWSCRRPAHGSREAAAPNPARALDRGLSDALALSFFLRTWGQNLQDHPQDCAHTRIAYKYFTQYYAAPPDRRNPP